MGFSGLNVGVCTVYILMQACMYECTWKWYSNGLCGNIHIYELSSSVNVTSKKICV